MKTLKTFDLIFAWIFVALAVACAYGIIKNGAWWHVGTMAISVGVAKALFTDAKKQEKELASTLH